MADAPDRFAIEDHSPIGARPVCFVRLADPQADIPMGSQTIVVGIDADGALPAVDPAIFDVLLTTAPDPPAPWVVAPVDQAQVRLAAAVARTPHAAAILRQVLRATELLTVDAALTIESLAYSTLLGGAAFRDWLQSRSVPAGGTSAPSPVRYDRDAAGVTITLDSPATRNATDAAMRDALCAMLGAVIDDPSRPDLVLRGAGRCFSTGGAIGEFGHADDLALAHTVRTLRSPAALLHKLGRRATVIQHGVSIGAGVEIAAAAAHRVATRDASFQMPELRMGLIPGAGGTVTVPRAIGRHRASWLMLTGQRIGAPLALRWGLIHQIA